MSLRCHRPLMTVGVLRIIASHVNCSTTDRRAEAVSPTNEPSGQSTAMAVRKGAAKGQNECKAFGDSVLIGT